MTSIDATAVPARSGDVTSKKCKRRPVDVEASLHAKYKAYSQLTGISITYLVNRALNDWFDVSGEVRLKRMIENAAGELSPAAVSAVEALPDAAMLEDTLPATDKFSLSEAAKNN